MKIIKKIALALLMLQTLTFATETECGYKKFLTTLINSTAEWKIVKEKITHKITPIEKLMVDEKGSVWIQTYKADPFSVLFGISTMGIEEKLILSGVVYDISLPEYKELKVYEKREFLLKPYKNDCSLKKMILEVVISDMPDDKRRESFVLERVIKK